VSDSEWLEELADRLTGEGFMTPEAIRRLRRIAATFRKRFPTSCEACGTCGAYSTHTVCEVCCERAKR
jgi:hypothetical protein